VQLKEANHQQYPQLYSSLLYSCRKLGFSKMINEHQNSELSICIPNTQDDIVIKHSMFK
jgi:hypothetical protein